MDGDHIRVNTEELRSYATRLNAVIGRINTLDSNMHNLWWQVRLRDLMDIINANILFSLCLTLEQARDLLNTTALEFESVEDEIRRRMGETP